jgi:hypothetical protein
VADWVAREKSETMRLGGLQQSMTPCMPGIGGYIQTSIRSGLTLGMC